MKYVIAGLMVISFSTYAAVPHTGADFRAAAKRAEAAYAVLGPIALTATIVPLSCGEKNAAYVSMLDTVFLCTELESESTDAVTMVIAHEFGHAVMRENGLSMVDPEDAADELASLVLLTAGDRNAVVAGAEMMMRVFPGGDPDDSHSSGMDRARQLLCANDGYDGKMAADPNCAMYLRHAVASWLRILKPIAEAKEAEDAE